MRRLLRALGLQTVEMTPRDRPDVSFVLNGRRIGVEVTQFHSDEVSGGRRGSGARAEESRLSRAAQGGPYYMWVNPDPHSALAARIHEKIAISQRYESGDFDELWLLVAAGIPKVDAVASTALLPFAMDLPRLSASTGSLLERSRFAAVYVHAHLPAGLFWWSRQSGWQQRQPPQT